MDVLLKNNRYIGWIKEESVRGTISTPLSKEREREKREKRDLKGIEDSLNRYLTTWWSLCMS